MAGDLQPLYNNQKIVGPDGYPTEYFIRWAQQRQIDISSGITAAQAQQLIDDWAAARDINTGTGLIGGGNLSVDRTLALANTTVTPGSYTNTNLTVDAQGRITAAANGSGSSSGGSWAILNQVGGILATGPSVTIAAPVANVDFINITGFSELLLIARDVTGSVSSFRAVNVSVDNGLTFFTTLGDYQTIAATGIVTNVSQFDGTSAQSALARTFFVNVQNIAGTGTNKISTSSANINRIFVGSTSPINAIRYRHSDGGNVTGGTLTLLAR